MWNLDSHSVFPHDLATLPAAAVPASSRMPAASMEPAVSMEPALSIESAAPMTPCMDERDRLEALENLRILDTPPEREFDTIVETARRLLGCKIALVSLIDDRRQWFKAKCGLAADETPREMAFCAHAVAADDVLVVPDARDDKRFSHNPLVTDHPNIRFYAGVPVRALGGDRQMRLPIGTLCVIDDTPREPKPEEMQVLRDLAHLVEALLDARAAALTAVTLAEERRQALRVLDRTHRQFQQAERIANIGSWRLTLADNKPEWSAQTCVIHGVEVDADPDYGSALDHYPPHARTIIAEAIQNTIRTGEPFDVETDFVSATGQRRRVRSMGELEVADGAPVALIGVFQDITPQYAMEQALRRAADTDELTGLASRGRCNQVVDDSIAARRGHDEPMALLLIDLDHFKSVNDRFGHLAGDDLLQLITARLRQPYLGDSFAARMGGDEFVVLVTCPQLLADLPGLLRRLLAELCHPVREGGGVIDVSATIGVAWFDRDSDDRISLMRRADAALYEGKRARRGSAVIAGDDEHIVSLATSPALRLVS